MKKFTYEKPELEIIPIETFDPVLTSGVVAVKDEVYGYTDPFEIL